MKKRAPGSLVAALALTLTACASSPEGGSGVSAYVGATIIDGTGAPPIRNGVLLVENGAVRAVGPAGSVPIPGGATRIDLTGRTVIPGLINTHGHAGDVVGMEANRYSRENVLAQLGLYARYGVTTVVSLGADRAEGVQIREEQDASSLNRARLFVAGPVLTPSTPQEAVQQVGEVAAMGVDWAKIRIDSSLGTATKMNPQTYRAVITEAHRRGLPVAVHIVELADGKGALEAGADFIAHSVRDLPVDNEFVRTLVQRGVCYSPTLTRELSTFVYGTRPAFFDDPFFLREADPQVLAVLQQPERQAAMRESASARYWQAQLPLAMRNLKTLSEAGALIGMGTDTGPAARFQGYFEHLELEMMVQAGMTPMQVLVSATGNAAKCVKLDQELGTLTPGKRADFVVLTRNPLDDIRNTRTIESVWINGNRVPPARN